MNKNETEGTRALMETVRTETRRVLTTNFNVALNGSPYDTGDLMEVAIYAAMERKYPEGAADELTIGKPKLRGIAGDVPSADTLLSKIAAKPYKEILVDGENTIGDIIKRARNSGAFPGEIDVALDIHNVYRHSKKMFKNRKKYAEDIKFVKGTKEKNGAYYAHQYMTVQTINARENYTLSVEPVIPLAAIADCARRAIQRAEEHLGKRIRTAYIDGGGYGVDMILLAQERKYVIRAVKDDRIQEIMKKAHGLWCWLERGYEIKNEKGCIKTNIVVVDLEALKSREHSFPLVKDGERYLTFATNLLPEEGESELDFCIRIAIEYKGRWSIETSYRDQNHFHAQTHSLSYSVRLFLFILSVVLYDIYQVVSFLLSQKEEFMSRYRKKMPKRVFSLAVMLMTFEALGMITVHLK